MDGKAITTSHDFSPWTLAAVRERGLHVEGVCGAPGCGHFVIFDTEALIARLGADFALPETLDMDCPSCGGPLLCRLAMLHPPPG